MDEKKKSPQEKVRTNKDTGEEAVNLFKGLVPLLNKWFEEKLGAVLPVVVSQEKERAEPVLREQAKKLAKNTRSDRDVTRKENPAAGGTPTQTPKEDTERDGDSEAFTLVTRRKKKSKAKEQEVKPTQKPRAEMARRDQAQKSKMSGSKPPLASGSGPAQGQSQGPRLNKARKPAKRRPPRAAAVTLTCPPGSYAEVMAKAKAEIDLSEIGITALRPKRAVTGAYVLEVLGPEGVNKAKILKDRLQVVVGSMDGVRVVRPIKTTDIRVKDVMEGTKPEEIGHALATDGACD